MIAGQVAGFQHLHVEGLSDIDAALHQSPLQKNLLQGGVKSPEQASGTEVEPDGIPPRLGAHGLPVKRRDPDAGLFPGLSVV